MGFTRGKEFPGKQELLMACQNLALEKNKKKSKCSKLKTYEQELRDLIGDHKEPVKPKTAFKIIKAKYNVETSYETFKRFAREKKLSQAKPKLMIRIELPPGREVQMDYGKVGILHDPIAKRNRVVYAFAGILSYSRKLFLLFYNKKKESLNDIRCFKKFQRKKILF